MVITLRISKELHARIKAMAKVRDESMNNLCISGIEQFLIACDAYYNTEQQQVKENDSV